MLNMNKAKIELPKSYLEKKDFYYEKKYDKYFIIIDKKPLLDFRHPRKKSEDMYKEYISSKIYKYKNQYINKGKEIVDDKIMGHIKENSETVTIKVIKNKTTYFEIKTIKFNDNLIEYLEVLDKLNFYRYKLGSYRAIRYRGKSQYMNMSLDTPKIRELKNINRFLEPIHRIRNILNNNIKDINLAKEWVKLLDDNLEFHEKEFAHSGGLKESVVKRIMNLPKNTLIETEKISKRIDRKYNQLEAEQQTTR